MNVKVFWSKQSCQFTGNIWELRWTDWGKLQRTS